MKSFIKIIIILFFSLQLFGCSQPKCEAKEHGSWDYETKTYIDESRNIKWVLSNIDNWRIAEDNQLPENTQFCAAADQFGICVSLLTIPLDKKERTTSIKNASKSFIDGMIASFKKQAPVFPGIQYGEPIVENVSYMFKDALRVSLIAVVTDERFVHDTAVPYAFQLYAFIKGDELIEVIAMVPQYIIDMAGQEPFDDLFNRLSYIDPTKELK